MRLSGDQLNKGVSNKRGLTSETCPLGNIGQGDEFLGAIGHVGGSTRRWASTTPEPDVVLRLEMRLGAAHARQRLGMEEEHEGQIFGAGINFLHIENWYSIHALTTIVLKASGLYWRGKKNAAQIIVRHNRIKHRRTPQEFRGFTVLQLSDLHCDTCPLAMKRLREILPNLQYDISVLTGDYRGRTYGAFGPALTELARVCRELKGPVYGVLGNHDTVRMVPPMEDLGIQMLLNETVTIERGAERICLAGIDDAHFYRADNIEKAASEIPSDAFSILLSHTPEVYQRAAHAGFNVMLSGHTHGGQICLPGGIPIELNAKLPRCMGAGSWRYQSMMGYTSAGVGTSAVQVRFNCPPEVTLHYLEPA